MLGSDVYAQRVDAEAELIRRGDNALPLLRRLAWDSDPETRERAREAIGEICLDNFKEAIDRFEYAMLHPRDENGHDDPPVPGSRPIDIQQAMTTLRAKVEAWPCDVRGLAKYLEVGGEFYQNELASIFFSGSPGLAELHEVFVADHDDDRLPDAWERKNGLDATQPNAPGADSDGDGLSDAKELERGTNPISSDTDADNIPDDVDRDPLQD